MRVKELVAEARSPLCSINFSRNAIAPKYLLNARQKKELNILRHSSSALIGVVAVHFIAIVSGQKSPASCSLFFSEIANQKQRNEQLHDRQWEKMPFYGALFGLLRCRVRLRAARVYAFRVAKICAQVNKPESLYLVWQFSVSSVPRGLCTRRKWMLDKANRRRRNKSPFTIGRIHAKRNPWNTTSRFWLKAETNLTFYAFAFDCSHV